MSLVLVGIQIQISITSNTLSNSLINFNKQEIKEFSWNLLGEYEKFEFIYPSDSIYKYIYKYIDNIAYIHMHVYTHTYVYMFTNPINNNMNTNLNLVVIVLYSP